MGLGGLNGMLATLRNNARLLKGRKTLNDRKSGKGATYSHFEDHKKMKSHEFAEFQKKIFAENARSRKKFRLVFWSSMIVFTIILIYFLFFYEMEPIQPLKWPE
jgi:hypothetical protein